MDPSVALAERLEEVVSLKSNVKFPKPKKTTIFKPKSTKAAAPTSRCRLCRSSAVARYLGDDRWAITCRQCQESFVFLFFILKLVLFGLLRVLVSIVDSLNLGLRFTLLLKNEISFFFGNLLNLDLHEEDTIHSMNDLTSVFCLCLVPDFLNFKVDLPPLQVCIDGLTMTDFLEITKNDLTSLFCFCMVLDFLRLVLKVWTAVLFLEWTEGVDCYAVEGLKSNFFPSKSGFILLLKMKFWFLLESLLNLDLHMEQDIVGRVLKVWIETTKNDLTSVLCVCLVLVFLSFKVDFSPPKLVLFFFNQLLGFFFFFLIENSLESDLHKEEDVVGLVLKMWTAVLVSEMD
ncbi:hypothetical protein M9H77_24275 [Catharanthus roseus]|uniref:Uncharacterized protein n=1 Tax=Catharanthus roseus TaxID=4058 RepID=A0ACC0AYA1_CATRO|nr:hypothetical protein M9H77_24275 [Catharanthus roseus]